MKLKRNRNIKRRTKLLKQTEVKQKTEKINLKHE